MTARDATLRVTLLAALSSGCVSGPDYKKPEVPTPASYRGAFPEPANQTDVTSFGDQKWWDAFQDDALRDLIRAALPYCTELRFLNPGIEVCVAHCHRRPWEPEKFSSPEDQAAMLTQLVQWVREYETREDEYGLRRHRQVFEQFAGRKREYTSVECYPDR